MKHNTKKPLYLFVFSIGLLSVFAFTNLISSKTAIAHEAEEVRTLIKEYLLQNGDVIMESVDLYQQKQQEEELKKSEEKLKEHIDFLTSKDAPSAGHPDAEIVIVEFFDYNCGYCKRAVPDIINVLDKRDNVRFVFREMPILSPASKTAALWALAAHKQGKYFQYHAALMQNRGALDEAALEKLAKGLDLDVAQMKKDAQSEEIEDLLEQDMNAARDIGVRGTPAFIIDGKLHRGYLGPEGIENRLKSLEEEKAKKG